MEKNNLFKQIAIWNAERGNFDYDIILEQNMLDEEYQEFYLAETLHDKMDAICDLYFVNNGTLFKAHINGVPSPLYFHYLERFEQLCSEFIFEAKINWLTFNDLFERCMIEVINANNKKGKEKVNGKIQKGIDWYDPKDRIKEIIQEML